jgi:hypothetical protein
VEPEASRPAERPPWQLKTAEVDKSLTLEVSKKDAPVILKALAVERINSYNGTVKIYTDASKLADGKTARIARNPRAGRPPVRKYTWFDAPRNSPELAATDSNILG